MKNVLICFLSIICGIVVFAEVTPEVRAKIQAKRAERLASLGGLVTKVQKGNVVRVVNTQDDVSLDMIKSVISNINVGVGLPIEFAEQKPGACALEDVKILMKSPKTGALLYIVKSDKLPSILSAPEDAWAILNFNSIADDFPPDEVKDARISKELNRAFANVFNAGLSVSKPCVMVPVYGKVDLDGIKVNRMGPEISSKIAGAAVYRDINPIRTTTYQRACEEGWAPVPTNDVQKSIWEKVHALPTQPIKIKPEKTPVAN